MSDPPLADQVTPWGESAEEMTYQPFDLYVTFSLEDFPFCLGAGRTKTKQENKADSQ